MTAEIAIVVSIFGIVVSAVFAIISACRNSRHDSDERTAAIVGLQSDMGYVKSGIDDIKKKQWDSEQKLTAAVESSKSAHKRLDEHEKRLLSLEEHDGGVKQ